VFGNICSVFGGVSVCCVSDSFVWIWGSESILCLPECFVCVCGSEFLLYLGEFLCGFLRVNWCCL